MCRWVSLLSVIPAKAGIQELAFVVFQIRYNQQMKSFYVYILASKRNGTLYVGVTSNLARRIFEHREGLVEGFSKKYKAHILVWYEAHDSAEAAIIGLINFSWVYFVG